MTSEASSQRLSVDMVRIVDQLCDQFEQEWQEEKGQDEGGQLEQYLDKVPLEYRDYLLQELISIERHYRCNSNGEKLTLSGLIEAHPTHAAQLEVVWNRAAISPLSQLSDATIDRTNSANFSASSRQPHDEPPSDVILAAPNPSHGLHIRCPHCCHQVELLANTPYEDVTCNSCGSAFCLVDRRITLPGQFRVSALR